MADKSTKLWPPYGSTALRGAARSTWAPPPDRRPGWGNWQWPDGVRPRRRSGAQLSWGARRGYPPLHRVRPAWPRLGEASEEWWSEVCYEVWSEVRMQHNPSWLLPWGVGPAAPFPLALHPHLAPLAPPHPVAVPIHVPAGVIGLAPAPLAALRNYVAASHAASAITMPRIKVRSDATTFTSAGKPFAFTSATWITKLGFSSTFRRPAKETKRHDALNQTECISLILVMW